MATIDKDFKIKNGLVVEGSTATVNGNQVLTENESDSYIIGLIGGSATSNSVANSVVLRDGNANFAANVITATLDGEAATVDSLAGHLTSELTEDSGALFYTDGRVKDVLINSTQTNISITEVAGELHITAENGVADSDTDDLQEGTTNKYFTEARVRDALTGGDGITFNGTTGDISVDTGTGIKISGGQVALDRAEVDGYYEAANAVANHANVTSTHGVTGDIVGTSDTQTLTNKTIGDVLTFNDGSNNSTIDVDGNHLYINANDDLTLSTANGDIVLNPDGAAYIGSASAENEIATHSYVDNAVSGLSWKQSVNLLANSDVNMTGSTGTLVIDGHSALDSSDVGYRILLTNQDVDSENGIYTYTETAGTYTLVRTEDADTYTELVGAAVYVMEGTTYGSTSWVQGNHYLSDFTSQSWTQFSGQGSVTAGDGITVDGLEVSVDRTTVDTWYDANGAAASAQSAAESYADGLAGNYDPSGSAATAYSNAVSYADGLASNYDPSGSAATAYSNAVSYADGLAGNYAPANVISTITTDDVTEGTFNHYYTDGRAEDAAGNLLAGATKSNIDITYVGGVLSITAENGVADSDTDDLTEGSTNLYFTDQRALDAVSGSDIAPSAVDINTYRREEATQQYVASASTVTAHTFTGNKSVKYLVRIVGTEGGTLHSQITELLATVDGNNNVAVTEYGTIYTSASALGSATVDHTAGEFRLRVTTAVAGAEVVAAATIMSWAD